MASLDDLHSFDVSPERGFLPKDDPLTELPAAFAAWDCVARDLPRLIPTGRLRTILAGLPELDTAGLGHEAEWRRAMLLLSYLGHAYVWGEDPPADHLPAVLARPWCAVAAKLGRPPVLSYASYALDNWRRLDPEGEVEIGNFALLQNFLGGVDEDWFIAIHIDIESKAAPLLREIGPLAAAAAHGDCAAVASGLVHVAAAIERLVSVLQRMPEYCDPYVYYRRVRPFIHGWKNQPALPQGLVYEGVACFADQPQRFRGETGAQSALVPALDALLAVEHADDPLRAYLLEMRNYMPPRHRAFVNALATMPSLRDFVAEAADSGVTTAYNGCLQALEAFRSTHLEYAARYIHRQSQCSPANPTATGTGGTPFMPYLKKHRDETTGHRIPLK